MLRSPLQHGGDQSFGTTRLFRAQKVVCDDGVVRRLPVYSGNAVRGLLRDIAAEQLMAALNVELPPPVFDFLTSGGSLTSGSSTRTVDVDLARRLRNTVPVVGLFGGGTGNQILEGKLIFLQGMPVCRETRHLLPGYCGAAPSANLSIRELRDMDFATRRDDKKKEDNRKYLPAMIPQRQQGDVATQMKFETEVLAPGTCLRFGFVASGVTDREWQALAMALLGFLRKPFLGGRSAAGYGELAVPSLYRARREVSMLQADSPIVDLESPLATVESVVDLSDPLQLLAEQVEGDYLADVRGRRAEIIGALSEVV